MSRAELPTTEGVWFAEDNEREYNKIREGAEFRDVSRSKFLRQAGTLLAELDEILHENERYFPNEQEKHAFIKQCVIDACAE